MPWHLTARLQLPARSNSGQWLGLAGGLKVAGGVVPQIFKVLRTRSGKDLLAALILQVIFAGEELANGSDPCMTY